MHRFDSEARLILLYAKEEAQRLGHARIAPEHLLLGALRLEGGAVNALRQLGLGISQARQKLEDKVGRREPLPNAQVPDISEAATACMEAAAAEARRLQAEQIGVGHVLLGVLRTAELSTRQMTGGLTVAQILGELQGGVRGVLRRVLESLRQPQPMLLGLQLEPVEVKAQLEPVEVKLQLEPALFQKLFEYANQQSITVEDAAKKLLLIALNYPTRELP